MAITPTREIIADIAAGGMVILVDEEDRENEGDLVLAAQHVTAESINFMITHARGLVCLALTEERARALNLWQMARENRSPHGTAFTVSIEAAKGVTTGISAHDRAHTIRTAVGRNAKPEDLVQPGHIFPIVAKPGGVLVRAGHTEAGCDLAARAGCEPAAVICEIMKSDGSMARLPDLIEFADQHQLRIGTIRDLIHYRSEHETLVHCLYSKTVHNSYGTFLLHAFSDQTNGEVHIVLTLGKIDPANETLVRVQERVSLLDFLDCSTEHRSIGVDRALRAITHNGNGVLVLLHRQDSNADFVERLQDPAKAMSYKWDPRLYGIGAQILRALGVRKMKLIASPRKMPSMTGFGLEVTSYLPSAELEEHHERNS